MPGHEITHAMPLTIFLVAYIIWGLGALTALVSGGKVSNKIYSAFLFLGSIALLSGVVLAWPDNFSFVIAKPLEIVFCPLVNRIDALSSIFLALLGVCTSAIAVFSPGYLEHIKGRMRPGLYWLCIYAFVAAMSQVVLSANAMTFLLFFEIMSVSAAALVLSQHQKRQARHASLIYLGISRVATAFLTAGFVWFFYLTNSWSFTDWRLDLHGMLMPSIFVFLGLAIKAGLFPFHDWMPYVYSEAPAPVAALMSGVKIKVVIYALIRLLILSGPCNVYLAYTLLGLGIISALRGILFAVVQSDLKRLLAYSSVENVGLIFSALGLTILAHANKLENIAAIALSAVLLHCVNHSIFKTLLFMNAGAIETSARTTDLAVLGGLSKKMPWTLVAFFVSTLAITAMPPLNGFASKWLLYQGFFQWTFVSHSLLDRVLSFAAIGIFSMVGALSIACFSKAVGISFLGRSRSESVANAREVKTSMLIPQIAFSVICIALGLFPSEFSRVVFSPVLASFLHNPAPELVLPLLPVKPVAIAGLAIIALIYLGLLNREKPALREYSIWDCGYGDLPARAEETGPSFSQPIAVLFKLLLQYRVVSTIEGKDRRHFPEAIQVETFLVPVIEQYLYKPTINLLSVINRTMVTLQTGSIHVHLLYVFVTILLLVWLGTEI